MCSTEHPLTPYFALCARVRAAFFADALRSLAVRCRAAVFA